MHASDSRRVPLETMQAALHSDRHRIATTIAVIPSAARDLLCPDDDETTDPSLRSG
jgi:hypothetical protein